MSRIPADKSVQFASWKFPEVKEGQIVQAEKLRKRGPRGQLVNVSKDEIIYNSLTAGQLEEISNQAYEELREQAHKEGFVQGQKAGYLAGLEAGKQTIEKQALALGSVITALYDTLGSQDDEVEQALVNVATCLASAVLRRELTIDSSHIQQVVKEAVAALPMGSGHLTVFLSDQDYQLLKAAMSVPEGWQLQVDPTLTAGGCRVSSLHSAVDYTLEEQFQQTVNALIEQRFAELAQGARDRNESNPVNDDTSVPPPEPGS